MKLFAILVLFLAAGFAHAVNVTGQVQTVPEYLDANNIDPLANFTGVVSPSSRLSYFFKRTTENVNLVLHRNNSDYRLMLASERIREMITEVIVYNNTGHLDGLADDYVGTLADIDEDVMNVISEDPEGGLVYNRQSRILLADQNILLHALYPHTPEAGQLAVRNAFDKTVELYKIKRDRGEALYAQLYPVQADTFIGAA